ncbi:FAD-binding oxidoreductase [Longispora fulva]|uniref:FAD/FMN-containing dehydrogenase n=1 Tax=Longispora fulva TaxID=619741 RepID=A0A8J7G7L5_9ACTN|nr:FAD-dependent oxidoreductase [Longispora fulva]MBG6134540.1 FAD/FMN-containing dehydrogenase [Longispora fulva]
MGISRRDLVRSVALGTGGLLAGCTSTSQARPPSATTRVTQPPPDWSALGRSLAGDLVRPGDNGYETGRLLFDPRFDASRPAGIAYCAGPADVAECLRFARLSGVPVTPRSGGHSFAGYSTGPGLVIDVTRMNTVSDVGSGRARVGAGTRLVDLYTALDGHGVTVPGGSCPTVGVAGLALGGGIGVVSRAYGTLSDNVAALRIVTPDGIVRDCDAEREPDLFWACRGGGGGNFGVVTEFTFTTHQAPEPVLFFLNWPWRAAARVISAWQDWAPAAPDQLWSNLHALSGPEGPTLQVGGTWLGTESGAAEQISRLVHQVGSSPSGSPFRTPYLRAMMIEAGCGDLSAAQCHLPAQDPAGRLARESEFARSHIVNRRLSADAVAAIIAAVEGRQGIGGGGEGGIALDALGGAVNRVAPGATAFVHRDGLFLAQFTTTWTAAATPDVVARQQDWLRAFHTSMAPHASGRAYQNYLDPELTDWRRAYYADNYPRLLDVQRRYDPERLFCLPQGIGAP